MPDAIRHFEAVRENGFADGEFILKRKDGSRFWARVTASRLSDTEFIAFKQDISSQKAYERDLDRARELANEANQAKSMFLANMSHEIRTPLNAIVAMSQVLRFTQLSDEQLEYLENIDLSVDSLLGLISDVLDISRIEAGKVDFEPSDFSPSRCLEEILRINRAKIEKKGLKVGMEIPEELPDMLRGDQLKFKQILLNLLSNAIKFTDSGLISIAASILQEQSECVLLKVAVRDTGIGISDEILPLLFEPFAQGGPSINLKKTGGTGLGLAICRQLATFMGGKIWAESVVGQGSCFYLELPFQIPDKGHRQTDSCPVSGRAESAAARQLTVLVAEDNVANMLATRRLLEKLGHRTVSAHNGREALEICLNGGVDLVLMDVQMPEMNGIDAITAIREAESVSGRHTPVLAATAAAMNSSRDELLSAGFDGCLFKPFKSRQLLESIEKALAAGDLHCSEKVENRDKD